MMFIHPGAGTVPRLGRLRRHRDRAVADRGLARGARRCATACRFAWLAVAVALGVAVPSLQWLLVHADTVRAGTRARVRDRAARAPGRAARHHLGFPRASAATGSSAYAEAEEALSHAAETSPSPRILHEWALRRGDGRPRPRRAGACPERPRQQDGLGGLTAASMSLRRAEASAQQPSSAATRQHRRQRIWTTSPATKRAGRQPRQSAGALSRAPARLLAISPVTICNQCARSGPPGIYLTILRRFCSRFVLYDSMRTRARQTVADWPNLIGRARIFGARRVARNAAGICERRKTR